LKLQLRWQCHCCMKYFQSCETLYTLDVRGTGSVKLGHGKAVWNGSMLIKVIQWKLFNQQSFHILCSHFKHFYMCTWLLLLIKKTHIVKNCMWLLFKTVFILSCNYIKNNWILEYCKLVNFPNFSDPVVLLWDNWVIIV